MLVVHDLGFGVRCLGPDGVVGAGGAGLEDYSTPSSLCLLWCVRVWQLHDWSNSSLCRIWEEAFPSSLKCSLLIIKHEVDCKYKPEIGQ